MNNTRLLFIHSICALLFSNAQLSHAQTESADTTSFSTTLQEIVVEASKTAKMANKDVYYPTPELRKSMSTSSQLLADLQIPDLIVNLQPERSRYRDKL